MFPVFVEISSSNEVRKKVAKVGEVCIYSGREKFLKGGGSAYDMRPEMHSVVRRTKTERLLILQKCGEKAKHFK